MLDNLLSKQQHYFVLSNFVSVMLNYERNLNTENKIHNLHATKISSIARYFFLANVFCELFVPFVRISLVQSFLIDTSDVGTV